ENDGPGAAEAMRALYPQTGHAQIVGMTGPPGGGKSTLVNRLAGIYRERAPRVAIVAVDPSSPFTGGAILGDRIRMRERFLDEGVFIRSMASRGHAGGLARATARVVNVLDALGTDVVLVETVGVGQEEVDVIRVVDTVCLVTVPGLGDDIQAIKAGVLEIADVLVVNKADRPGADETARDLAQMLSLATDRPWKTPIVRTGGVEIGASSFVPGATDQKTFAPVWSALLRTPEGNIVFDTGLHPVHIERPEATFGPGSLKVVMAKDDAVVSRLAALGVRTDDVTIVVNSHLHFDHAGNNGAFPKATFIVQGDHLAFAKGKPNFPGVYW